MSTILIVEDDTGERSHLLKLAKKISDGNVVHVADSVERAETIYRDHLGQFDAIVLDLDLRAGSGVKDGIELMRSIRKMFMHTFPPALILRSNYEAEAITSNAFLYDLMADKTVTKAYGAEADAKFELELRDALKHQDDNSRNTDYVDGRLEIYSSYARKRDFPNPGWFRLPLLGGDYFRNMIMQEIGNIGPDDRILLVGENGTGKGMLARVIHIHNPRRRKQKFCQIGVNTISPELLASDLYGHEAEAFTGATKARLGRIRSAASQDATIFLDEVGWVDGTVQAKLLELVERGTVTPVGGDTAVPVKALIIASCQSDSEAGGTLVTALHKRFSRVIRLQPLRERRDEIWEIMEFCRIAYYRHVVGLEDGAPRFSDEVTRLFHQAHWQGNLRRFLQILGQTFFATLDREDHIEAREIERRHVPQSFFVEELGAPGQGPTDRGPTVVSFPVSYGAESATPDELSRTALSTFKQFGGSLPIDDPSYLRRLKPEFLNPPLGKEDVYGIMSRAEAVLLLMTLDRLNQKNKAAEFLGVGLSTVDRWIKDRFCVEEQARYFKRTTVGERNQ